MSKIIENATRANYESYCKFFDENFCKFSESEYIKYYAKLCEYEKIYDMYYWGFNSVDDNPDYF